MKNIKELFKRYLSNRANDAEKKRIEDWYTQMDKKPPVRLADHQWQQLEETIWQKLEPQLQSRPLIRKLSFYLKIAACIVAASGAALWIVSRESDRSNLNQITYQEFKTGTGERKQLTLSDGTSLILNSASSVRVHDDFSKVRTVDIVDGEAFFDVHHNPKVPFIIHTGSASIRVLGTAFNVKSYQKLHKLIVSVTRGKVGVSNKSSTLGLLTKNQQLTYSTNTGEHHIRCFEEEAIAWQQGKLFLKNTDFNETALTLYNQYGIRFITGNPGIKKQRFTASLPNTLTAIKAAEILASIHHLKIKQRRDTIEFTR